MTVGVEKYGLNTFQTSMCIWLKVRFEISCFVCFAFKYGRHFIANFDLAPI
jgi:hypothetical protein